jgi:DNA-binding CsgD family transcriptional regulator
MMARISELEKLQQGTIKVMDAVYGAVGHPDRWPEMVAALTDLMGGGMSALIHRRIDPVEVPRLLATNLDPAFGRSYEEYYGTINPWALGARRNRSILQVNDDVVSTRELEASEFYADWVRPLGVRFPINTHIQLARDETLELTVLRVRERGAFGRREEDVMRSLVPHIHRAMDLSRRIALAEAGRTAALTASQTLGTGIVLVDSERRVQFMDTAAEALVQAGDGLWIREGRLRTVQNLDEQLRMAVARATGEGRAIAGRSGKLLRVPRAATPVPLSVAIAPVDERDRPPGLSGPLAMVLVTNPDKAGHPGEEALRAMFDLTAAEARLVEALCAGETLATYASATGTSLNTVKTHLKNVFSKTGETRQADLIRRMSGDAVLRLG